MILLLTAILLFTCYSILIIYYWQSWRSIPGFIPSGKAPQLKISVIIPARNEALNIAGLLKALNEQDYPKDLFEVIVVDDHSTDGTAAVAGQFPSVKLVTLQDDKINSYKKKAIETGIATASGEFIITTDADCIPGKEWLRTIAAFKNDSGAICIAAPVIFTHNASLLQVFQALDFLVLQGITAASVYKNIHSMCNGANFAYERKAFYEVNGFAGVDHIASGDDMLLMYKIWREYPRQVYYLRSKDAIVSTQPMKTWKEFFNQRIRWASKAKYYDDKTITLVLALVYSFNLLFPALFVAGFFNYTYWLWLVGLWVAKTIVEFPLLYSVASFFGKQSLLKYFFFLQPLHIAYTILSGFLGLLGRYEWKGRRVK